MNKYLMSIQLLAVLFLQDNIKCAATIDTEKKYYPDERIIDASASGNKEQVVALINLGADVNFNNNGTGTALIWAAMNGHKEIVELLIKSGADINATTDGFKTTALMQAANNINFEIVQLLLNAGANIDQKDSSGKTAADAARNSLCANSEEAQKNKQAILLMIAMEPLRRERRLREWIANKITEGSSSRIIMDTSTIAATYIYTAYTYTDIPLEDRLIQKNSLIPVRKIKKCKCIVS